jgi:PAS domain S-box-containing protein
MLSESLPSTNTQDQARLLKALRESELLRELSELLASSLDPSHILQTLVRRTTEVCDVERCAVWLLDERHRQFLPSAYHFSTSNIKQRIIQAADYTWHHSTLPLDHPIIHRLFEEEGVLAISDLKQEKSMEAFAEKFFARSALLVALIRKDRPVGLMSLDNLARRTIFTPEQQQLARAVGQQAAVAIDNARLYYEAQEARKQAEKLSTRAQSIYQVAMAVNSGAELVQIMEVAREHLVQELQAQSAAIALLDDKGSLSILQRPEPRTPQTFPIAALTNCTHVMKQYQPYFLLQQQQSPTEQHLFRYLTMGNVMIVPLLVGQQNMQTQNTPLSQAISLTQRCVGFAFINYGQKHDAPDQDHYTFAQDIAAHCAMAIEKAAILTRAEHAARLATEHANTLDAIFNAMTEGLLVLDKQGKVVISNSSASRFLGLKRSGKKFLTDYLKRHKLYTPEGNTLPPEQFPALRALASESVRKERFLHKHNNGKEQILEANIAPLLDSGKEKIGVVSALRDITEQVRFETAMRESNALKDEFLAITAHEFRTPLTVILAHGQMMARLLSRTPDVAQDSKSACMKASQSLKNRRDNSPISSPFF